VFSVEVAIKKIFCNIGWTLALFLPLAVDVASNEKVVDSIDSDVAVKALIITSIKPLALIAQAALGNTVRVEFLQSASQSAHELTLNASALDKIHRASLVILIGGQFEPRISKVVHALSGKAVIQALDLPLSEGKLDTNEQNHPHNMDPHVWLNPYNANVIAHAIQSKLGVAQQNVISESQINALKNSLKPVSTHSYISHHAVLGHFSQAFNVSTGMSIRDSSGGRKGAKSQYLMRNDARSNGAQCVFVEPQYADKDALVISSALGLPLREIDPQGIDIALTAEGYTQFIQALVVQYKACFT
jgi:zinc transport system substrate-binding protein